MAINCSITEKEFEFVYGMTKSFIQNKIDNNQVFDISSYMDYLYERVKKATSKLPDSKKRTAQLLAESPKIIESVYYRNFNQPNLDKFFIDFEKIGLLKRKFSQKDIELANVTEYFEKANKVDVRNNKRSLENTKNATKLTLNPTFDKNASPRLVSRTVLSGTLPAFKSVKRGKLRVEEPDIERIIINRNFESIINQLNVNGSDLNQFVYQGVSIRLTALNLGDFTGIRNPETAANLRKLDGTTQQEIATSRTLGRRGIQRADVTQVDKRAIMLVTDLDGNPLSFDNEGNIVESSNESGKYVFQFMRDIKKLEDGSFEVKDIFGSEDRIATPTEIAEDRRAVDKSKTPNQHLEDVLNELEFYKEVRDKALTEPVALDLVGMTPGLSASLKTKDIKLSDLREKKVATNSNISKIITLDKKFQNFGRGSTIIKIQGEYYLVDRNRMPNEVASQIKDVLFKEDISLDVKKDFYSQFIPENEETILDYKMRRHKIIPFDNHLVLQLFTQRGSDKFKAGWPTENGVTKALKHEILIDNTGVYLKDKGVTDPNDYLSGYTKQDERQIEALKKEFNEVLTQAYTEQDPTPGATFMSYPRQFIENPRLFQTYLGNGKFKASNYIDFILSQPTIVKIQPTQNDMYNRQIIFKEPTITSKAIERSVENLEVIEIFDATPELSEIGTEQDYVKYIQSIFPKSQVKDILYHGTYQEFDRFSKDFLGENTGLGNYTDPKTGEVIEIDSANALFFSDNKINALTYAYIGREQFLNRINNSIDRILDGVTGEKLKEYVDFLKTIPYFNNLIEETKAKAKSQNLSLKDTNKLVKDQLRNERKRLRKARSKLNAKAAGNQINNLTTSINRLKTYKNNIERFQKNDPTITVENYQLKDLDFTGYNFRTFNETNEVTITFKDGRFQFKSKKDNGSFGLDFYADEVDAKTINNFLNSAIEGVESELEKYSETRKSLGYVDRVIPVVLNLENPSIGNYEASYFTDKYKGQEGTSTQLVAAKQVKAALESGNDGVVYENVIDPYISTNYGVFNTDQIHILGNAKDIDGFKKFMGVDAPTSNLQTSGGIEVIKPEQDITPKENKKQVDKDNDLDTEEGGYGDLFDELERSGDLEVDKVTKADIERAEDFWNNSETGKLLSKHISLQKAANLVNSDAYAKFIVSGATLANPDILGTIKINKAKGSMVDIYHEGFHAFTQLFLSPTDKKALYNEVLNFDANGNKPYENMDARQIEEMLAEDFRTYMKKAYVKKGSPKRNSIFRRILNFLKALFGKLKSVKVKDVKLDIMSVPAVNELFTNLKSGNKDFLNKYAAKISNAKFLELDRGITALEKTGRETRKRSILNKQDSDLVSESIDSAISEVIDRIYKAKVKEKKAANQQISPNFKAISLAALLDPKYRSKVYGDVKLQFQERVQELNTEFQDSIGGNTLTDIINSEDPFETLKDSVAGKLIAGTYKDGPKKGKKKTTDKYVLLESQIDSFDNLIPNTKKGQRTAGSSYWGIKIVGNYYTVPGLQDADGRPIEIIVVSDPEDVATQYDNYIDAGSTAYASFMTYNDRAPVLNDEQAVTFNQIRILTTALNNWGTLGDLNKNVAPTGTIAYHIKNSDFEIGKAKYYVADEVDPGLINNEDVADTEDPLDIDSDTEVDEGSTESLGMNPDLMDGKRSLLQLADKEVVYLLKSLHEIKSIDKKGKITYAKNRLGFRQRANFMKTWNIVSKTIGGVQDRQVAYDLLQKEAESYPVLKQLLDTKLPSPKGLTNSTAFSLNAAFWHTFAKPSAIYKQFTIKEKADKSGYDFYIEDSSPAINSILLKFTADFKSATSPYVNLTTEEQAAMLDSEGLIKETGREGVKQGMERTFLKALGINIDVTDKLNSVLASDESEPALRELASFVTKIADLKANKEKTTAQLNIILKFESDPIDFFKNKDRYIDELKEAGLYKKANEIRVDTAVKYFAGIQAKYGFDSPGEMIKLPDGNMASTVTNHMTLTSLTDGINSLDTLEDAWTLHTKSGYLGHLDPTKNFFINRSKTIDSLFAEEDAEGSRKRIEGSKLDFLAFAGSEIFNDEGSSGKTTSDLTSIDKFYQNLHYMLLGGIVEGSRAAEKNSAFGISPAEKTKIILDNGTRSGDNTRLWIDTDKFIPNEFANSVGEDIAIKGFMLDYIAVEFDRIKFFKENPEILETTKGFNKLKSNDVMAGLEFSYLEDVLSDSTKNKLYKLAEPKNEELTGDIKEHILNDADLLKAVTEDLLKYFDTQINDLYDNYLLRTPFELNKTLFGDDMIMGEEEFSSRARGVLSSYYYNSWISRFEQNNLVMGDMAQLDHAKEAGNKRLPGPQSNGTGFLIDEDAQTFVNEVWNKSSYAAKFEKEGIATLTTDGSINVGVVNDPERITLYLKEQEDAWREGYEADGLSEDVIKARLVEDNKKYKKIEEADGHAVITLDAYRMMKKLGGPNEWTAEQESLYQDIINGKSIDPKKAARFFPVYKLQYHGPIMNAKINTTMMLKYAVTPISPSWAKLGTEAYKLHKKMMKDNMPMITFGTGSKMGALSFTKGPAFDNIFNESKSSEYTTVNKDAEIAPNKLHLKYFKDVTKVSSKLKKENTLGTQDRVITLDTLYDKGELIEGLDPKLVAEYKKATEGISKIYKTELLERIGYEYINGEYKGNIKRLVSVLRNELELKEIPSQILDMLDVRLNDQLSYDFSVIPVADVIEKTLVNLISKSLVKQKTNGEALVNVPVTLFGGVWEPTWPSEEVKQEALAGNEELIKKFLGTNGLPSYRRGEVIDEATGKRKPTYLAKAAIAFNGQWVNLLNLKFQGKLIGIKDVDGSINMDASLENLNRLIKTDAFLEEHGDKIRIAGPRIPTDAINLKEAFEVWHFLPADAGSQVIVPTEIVAKAGSDFDLDKIFFSYPNIDANGQLPKAVPNFKEQLERLKSENKSTIGLIRQQKRYAQNEWLRTNINIIRDPLNYGALTKPTSDYLVRGHIEKYYLDRDGSYNPKKRNVHVQEERVTGTRVGEEQNDLEKHRELLGGNRPLGISAKKDKQHALYKSIGAKFPKTYTLNNGSGKIERKFVLNFNHEKTKDGNISLSSSTNVDNISISDIFSHGLQGILDRANDSFISKANIVKETLPVLNRLIESGVSFPIALDFINQPLIVEFIEGKIQSGGFISGELSPIYDSDILRSMASKLDEGGLDILENAYKYSNEKRMNEVLANLENSKFQGKILIEYMGARQRYNSLEDFKQKFNTDPSKITTLTIKAKGDTGYSEVFRKDFLNRDEPSLQSLKDRSYYVSEYLWNNYFDGKDATLTELRKNIDDSDNNKIKDKDRHIGQQLAALAHYFQIADQSTGMEQIEIFFNPDTKLVDTLVSVQNREAFIDALELDGKIDPETLQKLLKTSIISSLYESDIFLQLVPGLMPLRTMPKIVNYISNTLSSNRSEIEKRFGKRAQDKDRYISAFNNAIVDYIYQNVMSNYVGDNALPIQLPSLIKKQSGDYSVKSFTGTLAEPIKINDNQINVDLTKLKKIYKGDFFLSSTKGTYAFATLKQDSFSKKQNPFKTFDSFVRYAIEKQILYKTYSEDDYASKLKYESFISERALRNTNNRAYIMGTTKYSFTKKVLATIKKYPHLSFKYPILLQLSESFQGKRVQEGGATGLSLLELKDKKIITPEQAAEYAKNLEDLGNISIQKSNNKDRDKALKSNREISEVFANFSLMMYYQQGVGKSSLSFNKALNGVAFTEIMTNAVNSFMTIASDKNAQAGINEVLNGIRSSILEGKGYKNYLKNASTFLKIEDADLSDTEDTETTSELDKLKAQLEVAKLEQDADSVKSLSEAIRDLESRLAAEQAQGEFPVAPGVQVVSKEYGVTKVNTNPNASTTTSLIALMQPQILAQLYKENKGIFANAMFNYGYRWTRSGNAYAPLDITSASIKAGKEEYYAYDTLDQNQNPLPSINTLDPIIKIVEDNLGMDMSGYDSAIVNIYEGKERIYPHKDTSEDVTAKGYPVVVYSMGNDSSLGIWDDNKGKMTFAYKYEVPGYGPYKGMKPTNEVVTQNGSIYTFGMNGNGRFALTHTTPANANRTQDFPQITMPDGRVVTKYTVTVTFRRAAPLTPGMPVKPGRKVLSSETPLTPGDAVATYRQDLVSGIQAYGTVQKANKTAVDLLGPNPTSIDMIDAGIRTRTTRSATKAGDIRIGDVILHRGKSADGTEKMIYAKITNIHPKGSEEYKGTWSKEGWTAEGVDNIDRFSDGAMAIEFEVIGNYMSKSDAQLIKDQTQTSKQKEEVPVPVNSVEVGRFVGYKGNVYIALMETNQGWQIYNPRFEGPNSKLNVKLENLEPMKQKADLVLDDKTNRLYLITPDKNIISLTTGKLMNWAKNNGDRIRILSLVDKKESEKPPVELNAGQTFTGLTFNEGQADAIKKMKEFLNSDEQEFILEGKAGTGKTTVMKEVLLAYQNSKENRKKTILIGALSWQATNVLDSTLKGKPTLSYDKNSLAGMLNQRMDEITHKMTKATYSTEGRKVGSANLVIIDEASMVNEQHLKILRDQALNRGEDIKIIYLGDRGQLPPIREFTSNENSPVFKIENRAELKERVRQGEESPILPYADLYWDNADNENPVADPANGNRSSVTQQDGQLLFVDDSSAIDVTIQEYKKAIESGNYDLIKYVTYTNKRRFKVNKEIHREIFGEDAHFYTPTTPVRFNAPYDALENTEEISFINSDQAVVHKIIEQGKDDYGIAFVKLEILTPLSSKPVTITTVDYTKEALKDKVVDNAYNMRLNKLNARYYRIKNDPKSSRAQEKIALNEYLEYKRRYAPISQDYAVTSHKSQGSTYNTVIVDEVDIYNVKALTPKVRSNSMYTGITRAKNNVLIVSNKTTPYQGKITLLEDAAVQINQSTGVDTKLAKFYESLTPSQIEKLGVDSAQALQEKYDNLAFADTENSYTIEDFILDQTEKCKL